MLCFVGNIMSILQLPGKSNMKSFNLNVFANIFISTFHMEQMFTIGHFDMATFTGINSHY